MNGAFIAVFAVVSLILGVGCWLGWQLLRQNGRMLLRLDELEKRLDEWEFGDAGDEHPDESQGGARHSVRAEAEDGNSGAQGTDAPYPDTRNRANRFGNRSLACSKIKRDGLKAGTPAPDFRLPRLDGRGDLSLEELRGRRVLLVFSDPHCDPCQALAPQLERFHREATIATGEDEVGRVTPCAPLVGGFSKNGAPGLTRPTIVMISRGEPRDNRAKVKEHELTFPVVLQQRWEISRLYAMFATPIAYMINESGVIAFDVAVGVEPIMNLMAKAQAPEPIAE